MDYRDGNRKKVMTVTAEEFIRRFLLHVLPEGFQRIRHYGFLANRYREQKLACCRDLLKMPPPEPKCQKNKDYRDQYEELTGTSLKICPICHQGHMAVIEVFEAVTTPPPIIDTSCSSSASRYRSPHRLGATKRRDCRCLTPLQIVP